MHSPVFGLLIFTSLSLFFTLSEGRIRCSKSELPCDDGEQCIPRFSWCDDERDCNDQSDESFCETKSYFGGKDPNICEPHHFLCETGVCIPLIAKCDSVSDCHDGSDEEKCDENEMPSTTTTTTTPAPIRVKSTPATNFSQIRTPSLERPRIAPSPMSVNLTLTGLGPIGRGQQWLINTRRSNYGWDKDTSRALVALALSNPRGITLKSLYPKESELMAKQLQVHLAVDLFRNHSHPMTLSKLSQYINALLATCQNPRNFYGIDLVKRLRDRTAYEQNSRSTVNPFVYLTLCNAGESSLIDLRPLEYFLHPRTEQQKSQDMQSIAIMAYSCIVETAQLTTKYQSTLDDVISKVLIRYSPVDGNFGNVYSSALAVQAVIGAGMNGRWNSTLALKYLESYQESDGSFGDLLATYYILPALAGHSLLSLKHLCDSTDVSTELTPLDSLRNYRGPKYYIKYSLQITEPVDVSYTIMMHVPVNTTFFDIMRLAEDMDPKYRFMYEKDGNEVIVYSISGIPNDAERGIYWALYVNMNGRVQHGQQQYPRQERPYTRSVNGLVPRNGDHVTFSYEPAT